MPYYILPNRTFYVELLLLLFRHASEIDVESIYRNRYIDLIFNYL